MNNNNRKVWRFAVISAIICCMLTAFAPVRGMAAGSDDIPVIIQKATPSVVAIIGKPVSGKKSTDSNRFNLAHGTGVIIRGDGYIVTNAHVVKDMRNIVVVTTDGKSYPGKATHVDEESDLALVKIEATGLPSATFARAGDIRVGEQVMAIGTPLSFALRNSVTIGIVSGMDRSVQSNYQLIQTDAAINPGNSGGALVNMQGQVVGINTMKYVSVGVDSLGFAIPVDTVQYVVDQFFKYGKVKRPYLGLELEESWEAVVGLPSGEGLKVSYVEADSPAAQSGVLKGDLLLAVGGKQVRSIVDYHEALKSYLPGQQVALTVQSGSRSKSIDITLGEDQSSAGKLKQDQDGAYIDSDQGKTKIGDSHYGWSMDYPSGLVKAKQSGTGESVTFADSKGDFGLFISVSEKQSEDMSPYALLQKLSSGASDTLLEKQYVDRTELPYAKVIGKTETGSMYQVRAYLKKNVIYYVTLYVNMDDQGKSAVKQNSYNELLDSFKPEFDAQDGSLKDVSVFQSKNSVSTPYGISYDVPSDWTAGRKSSSSYSSKDGMKTVSLRVTSASSGDTLKDWASRQETKFTGSYADNYRETSGLKETVVSGAPAYENKLSSTMGDKWTTRRVYYFIKDKYKFRLELSYPKETEADTADKLAADLVGSVKFEKDASDKSLGFIQDEEDLVDPDRAYTYRNEKYKYSASVPEIWSSSDYDYDSTEDSKFKTFSFLGGSLSIEADDRTSLEDAVKKLSQSYKKSADNDADYKYTESDIQLFGGDVKAYSLEYKTKNVPYTQQEYVFRRGAITYTVRVKMNDAVKTDANTKRIEACLQSLRFLAD